VGLDLLSRFRKQSADDPPPTELWPLFAFGKLPVYKDFISAGLTDDASREFRDWLSNGFSRLWSARDDCRSTEIPLHAFVLGLPESRKIAVGALWGSTDQGGLRKFPFALFTILPAGKPVASVLSALDYLPVFETRAREIRRKYEAGGALADVYQELRGARIEVPVRSQKQIRVRLADALARDRVGPLATALFGADAAVRWPALLAGLDAAARHPAAGAAALRLPLAEGSGPLDQLKLWTERLTKASSVAPTGVLYRIGAAAPCGALFFRDARAEDVFLFHPGAIPTDFVEEIPATAHRTPAEAVAEPMAMQPAAAEPAVAPPPLEEIRLGAAVRTVEVPPAGLAAPAVLSAASEVPVVPESPVAPELHTIPESPASLSPPVQAADTSPPVPPPTASPAGAEPAGWDLPLASLLESA
jgi:type VI secretion system ImpM family protein